MMTWPLFKRQTPVLPVLTRSTPVSEGGDVGDPPRTLIVRGGLPKVLEGEWLNVGGMGSTTDVSIGFQYETTGGEDFVLCAALEYIGDNGAFQIIGDDSGEWATPVDLVDGFLTFVPITPDSIGDTFDLTIRALAVDADISKSGMLNIYDRFTFGFSSVTPTRLLLSVPMSKTYNP